MDPVSSITPVGEQALFWQGYESAVRADLSCCAIRTSTGLVLIDPIPLAPEPLDEIVAAGPPVAIILTNGNHQRASLDFRARFGCLIHAATDARSELTADHWLDDGSEIHGLRVITLPGSGAGEIALLATAHGILILGDALINLPPEGLRFLPEKYCLEPLAARASLQKLLGSTFDTLLVAHGPPVTVDARSRVKAVLDAG